MLPVWRHSTPHRKYSVVYTRLHYLWLCGRAGFYAPVDALDGSESGQ